MKFKLKFKLAFAVILFWTLASFTNVQKTAPEELLKSIEKKWPGSQVITKNEHKNHVTEFYSIVQNNQQIAIAYAKRVKSCRAGGCNQPLNTQYNTNDDEYFDYFAILTNSYSILEVKVYNYQSSHGEEICSKSWLKQFKGFDGMKKLRYGKEIDALSGATISGRALTLDIENTIPRLKQN